MFETGELAKVLDGIPKRDPRFVCESCGDEQKRFFGNNMEEEEEDYKKEIHKRS